MGGPSGANGSTKIGGTAIADPAAWADGDKTADATGNASNQLFSRGAFVGIEGGFGKINAGKISTHSNSFILGYTPGASNIAAVSFRTAATTSSGWLDNTVEYVSPAFSGLTARVLHTTGNTAAASTANESLAAADKKFGNGQEFGLSYVNGPLSAGVYTAERKLQDSAADKAKTNGIGASYNFGVAQVGVTSSESDPTGASTTDKKKGQSVAVTMPLNANVTLGGFFGQAKAQAGAKATFSSLNVDYALSKRTTAYTNYTTVKNSGDGTTSLAGMGTGNAATMGAAAANGTATAFGVGLRHSF
jgi:predicted porin